MKHKKKPLVLRIKDGLFPSLIPRTHHIQHKRAEREQDPCVYCGKPSDSDEHVLPKILGGKNDFNVARACKRCNSKRGAKPLLLFLLELYNETL